MSAPATIRRDAQGVAHIRASTDADAFFAVGYAHAQDRLWQLELQRRIARGRLSEVFGDKTINTDAWLRTLGIYESTASAWQSLTPQAQQSLTAYTAGINAWIAEGHELPIEFRILHISPARWTERDSLAWVKMFALDLGGNFSKEMRHYIARQSLSDTQLSAFFPTYPSDAPTTIEPGHPFNTAPLASLLELQDQLQRDYGLAMPRTGSNAWVVSGRHTRDGAALLANDPHLGLKIPSLWYAISIETPRLKTSGMGLVGLPLVVLGRNESIAWGGTNMMADTQDLFFERVDETGQRYEINGRWERFQTREEVIQVRADFPQTLRKQYAPIKLQVRSTRHGPVISDRYGVFNQPVALRWTGLDSNDTSYESFFRLDYARNWTEFSEALQRHVAPAMNIVYADRQGNIGYIGAGRLPIRKQGQGTLPSPGWDDAYGWSGYVPPSEWPQTYNPPSGYIVTANNKVVGPSYQYFISDDWAPPARAQRIEQLLNRSIADGKRLTIEDIQRMQGDTIDLQAAAMMRFLRTRLPKGEHQSTAARYLKSWDGDMRADSQAAAIFHTWMRHFRQAIFSNRLRSNWGNEQATELMESLTDSVETDQLLAIAQKDDQRWCDDRNTTSVENCDALLASSLESALWELHKLKGDWSMESWGWGTMQATLYEHVPFSQSKALAKIFERRIGNGGSANSISVAASKYAGSEGYLQSFGAGFRQVFSLKPDGIRHIYMNSTGQSGNIFSPHYDDMVEPFRNVTYYPLEASYDHAPGGRRPTVSHAATGHGGVAQ
ncbi:penicillin acylase family protein [Lysobacter tyrosinilyticus]